jgi:hypothetical protein
MKCGGKKKMMKGGMAKKDDMKMKGMKSGGMAKKDDMKDMKKSNKPAYKAGGKVKMRGTGCAKRGIYSRGPMA